MGRCAKSMMKAVWNKIRVCITANVCVTWPSEETDPTFSKARECVRVYTRTWNDNQMLICKLFGAHRLRPRDPHGVDQQGVQ